MANAPQLRRPPLLSTLRQQASLVVVVCLLFTGWARRWSVPMSWSELAGRFVCSGRYASGGRLHIHRLTLYPSGTFSHSCHWCLGGDCVEGTFVGNGAEVQLFPCTHTYVNWRLEAGSVAEQFAETAAWSKAIDNEHTPTRLVVSRSHGRMGLVRSGKTSTSTVVTGSVTSSSIDVYEACE